MRYCVHPHTANDWNSFLEKRYGYGLWEFADSISQFLILRPGFNYSYDYKTQTRKKEKGDFVEYLKENIMKFKSLKRHIIKTINDDLNNHDFWNEGKYSDFVKIRSIIKEYKLAPFFIELNKKTVIHQRMLSRLATKIKLGRPIHLRNQLASIWAQVIKDNRGSNWMVIELLLSWFFKNLKDAVYRKELGDEIDDFCQYNLKNEYYRLKRKYMGFIIGFKNTFFPEKNEEYKHQIEFHKDYVKINTYKENLPLIIFPNGLTFP